MLDLDLAVGITFITYLMYFVNFMIFTLALGLDDIVYSQILTKMSGDSKNNQSKFALPCASELGSGWCSIF